MSNTTRITNNFTKTDLWNEDRIISSSIWGMDISPYKGQLKVYLAGKISNMDWRTSFIDIHRKDGYFGGDMSTETRKFFFTHYGQGFNKDLLITGPFFIACDHSCFHGDGTHGVGVNKDTCDGGYGTLEEKDVVDICLTQITNSDIIFAYIYDVTCYGTIAELGYARKKNKKIFIVFSSPEIARKLWFVKNMADQYIIIDEAATQQEYKLINLNIDFYPIKPIISKMLPEKYIIE